MPENGTLQRKGTTTQGDAKRRKETVCKTRSCVEAEEGWSGEERIKVGGRLLAAVLCSGARDSAWPVGKPPPAKPTHSACAAARKLPRRPPFKLQRRPAVRESPQPCAQLLECIRTHSSGHHRISHPRPSSRDQETKQYHVSCQHERSRDRIHTTLISASLSLPRSSVHYHPCFHDMDTPQQALDALQREVNLIVSATIAANFCLLPPTLTQRTARIHRKAVCRRQQLGS